MGVSPLAVFCAAIAWMIIGFLWYSPIVFAKPLWTEQTVFFINTGYQVVCMPVSAAIIAAFL